MYERRRKEPIVYVRACERESEAGLCVYFRKSTRESSEYERERDRVREFGVCLIEEEVGEQSISVCL